MEMKFVPGSEETPEDKVKQCRRQTGRHIQEPQRETFEIKKSHLEDEVCCCCCVAESPFTGTLCSSEQL